MITKQYVNLLTTKVFHSNNIIMLREEIIKVTLLNYVDAGLLSSRFDDAYTQ